MSEALAWAGGLFEGEGCFTLKNGRWPQALLVSTDEETIDRLMVILPFGRKYGPYETGHKPKWHWQVGSFETVQQTVASLWPWLGSRRRERAAEVLVTARTHPLRRKAA